MADTESYYDEIEIEDMTYDPAVQLFHFPCPCGDRFEISLGDLRDGEDVAVCPSCSLMIKVVFDIVCKHSSGPGGSLSADPVLLQDDLPKEDTNEEKEVARLQEKQQVPVAA